MPSDLEQSTEFAEAVIGGPVQPSRLLCLRQRFSYAALGPQYASAQEPRQRDVTSFAELPPKVQGRVHVIVSKSVSARPQPQVAEQQAQMRLRQFLTRIEPKLTVQAQPQLLIDTQSLGLLVRIQRARP